MSRSTGTAESFALLVADVFDSAGILRREGEHIASSSGQTQARWQLLSVVSNGHWTVPAAADRLGVSRQAVQRVANDLVDDGLAAFVDNPRHRRSPLLQLTDEGRRVLGKITVRARHRHQALLGKLEGIDIDRLRQDLRHVTSVVRSELER